MTTSTSITDNLIRYENKHIRDFATIVGPEHSQCRCLYGQKFSYTIQAWRMLRASLIGNIS